MSSRHTRSPNSFSKVLPHKQMNGTIPVYYHPQQPLRHQCIRFWLKWLLPLLFVAVLSSYTTYLVTYQAPKQQSFGRLSGPRRIVDLTPQVLSLDALKQASLGQTQPAETTSSEQRRSSKKPVAAITPAAAAAGSATMTALQQQPAAQGPQQPQPASAHPPLAPTDAAFQWAKATGRRMTVAVVNEAPYHMEIVAGFLHILSQLPVDVTWYQAGQDVPRYSPVQLQEMQGFTQMLGYLPRMKPSSTVPEPVEFALFISPEYFEKQTQAFLEAAKPLTVVMLGHNGMNRALQRLQKLHPRIHFAALAPHVAASMRNVLHIHTHWMMATHPFVSPKPCLPQSPDAATCLSGFSIQGNFEAQRRNYTSLWQQIAAAHNQGLLPTQPPVKPFQLHLLGRGDLNSLGMLEQVKPDVTVHFNLKFPEYYDQIHRTHALLMLLGSKHYLIQKMSSTVVSSLMTATPVIADQAVLDSYTFLKPEHVFTMQPGETEMDVMQRVLRLKSSEVLAVKQRVAELAAHLNRRTIQVLQTFMPLLDDVAAAPAVV